jgi:hypothetical protein
MLRCLHIYVKNSFPQVPTYSRTRYIYCGRLGFRSSQNAATRVLGYSEGLHFRPGFQVCISSLEEDLHIARYQASLLDCVESTD